MYCIGLDIGGPKCAVSLGQIDGDRITIIDRHEVKTDTPKSTLSQLMPYAKAWIDEYGVRLCGISCGGPLDSHSGIIISTPNLDTSWHGFNIVKYVEEVLGVRAALRNDANASALAEWRFGAGRGTKNMIFMTFGTGLGAGLILDGRLYEGTNGNAGEIGHIRLAESGPIGFGKAGSAEGFCSGGGIRNLALIRAKERGVELDDTVTTKDIFARARTGDALCLDVIRESAVNFGTVLAILIDLFNPEIIVAGGVFMRNYDLFMPFITPIIEKEALNDATRVCKILPAEIGESIGDYAALAIATELMDEE